MNRNFIYILIISLLSVNLFASPDNFLQSELLKASKRFEIEATLFPWNPLELNIATINQETDNNNLNSSPGGFYSGLSLVPEIEMKFYIIENFAFSFAGNFIYMDYTYDYNNPQIRYYNKGLIFNFLLGVTLNYNRKSKISPYIEAGIDFVPYCTFSSTSYFYLTQQMGFTNTSAAEADALGFYSKLGFNLNIVDFFSIYSAIVISYVPVKLFFYEEYSANESTLETNLGGIGFQIGVLFDFSRLKF